MKIVYDPRYHIAYLRLHEKTAQVETLRLSDEINVASNYSMPTSNCEEKTTGTWWW